MRLKPLPALLSILFLALPSAAYAHPGHDHGAGFMQGMAHPVSGIDHILAMVMVGLFAVQIGGRALWALPATFMAAMAVGSLVGLGGIAASVIELGVGLSVVLLGIAVAVQRRWSTGAAMLLVGAVALFHGHAHGLEASGGVSAAYLAGFLVSTALLHAGGVIAGLGFSQMAQGDGGRIATRAAGAAGAVAGLALIAG